MNPAADALVVGGGPAGAALAIRLARAARSVILLERQAAPHDKVCGEFISTEAALALGRLGLDLQALGAVRIGRVRLFRGDRDAAAALPFSAFSLSRRRLDAALLDLAEAAGAQVRRGVKASALDQHDDGWRATTASGEVRAQEAFLAVGKHDLKGFRRRTGLQGDLVGFKMHWRLQPAQARALDGAVELVLFEGGYAGLEPIEDGLANLCLVVRQGALRRIGDWPALLARLCVACPALDARLAGAEPLWPRPLAIAAIPYGHLARPAADDGLWRLGDQAAVIPSFCGDGLAIALHSAELAAAAWLKGERPADYLRVLRRDVGLRVVAASALSHALVRGAGQAVAMAAARADPRLIAGTARLTRIPDRALTRAAAGGAPYGCIPRPGPG